MALFTVHKLVALAAVVSAAVLGFSLLKSSDPHAKTFLLPGVALICVVALFASGALMSAGKLKYTVLLAAHRVASASLVLALLGLLYLVSRS